MGVHLSRIWDKILKGSSLDLVEIEYRATSPFVQYMFSSFTRAYYFCLARDNLKGSNAK